MATTLLDETDRANRLIRRAVALASRLSDQMLVVGNAMDTPSETIERAKLDVLCDELERRLA